VLHLPPEKSLYLKSILKSFKTLAQKKIPPHTAQVGNIKVLPATGRDEKWYQELKQERTGRLGRYGWTSPSAAHSDVTTYYC